MFHFLYPQTGDPHPDLHHQKAISISKLMAVEAAINAEYHSYEIGLQLPNRKWTITGYPFGSESLSFLPLPLSFWLLRKSTGQRNVGKARGRRRAERRADETVQGCIFPTSFLQCRAHPLWQGLGKMWFMMCFTCDKEAERWAREGLAVLEDLMGLSTLWGWMLLNWIIIISTWTMWRGKGGEREEGWIRTTSGSHCERLLCTATDL